MPLRQKKPDTNALLSTSIESIQWDIFCHFVGKLLDINLLFKVFIQICPSDGYSELVLAAATGCSICMGSAIYASSMSPNSGADGSGVARFSSGGMSVVFSCFGFSG